MKIFFLIMILFNLLNADFKKTGDTVKNSISKLEFQDNAIVQPVKWEEAIRYCESLALANHNDWRLPNLHELRSILDRTKTDPAIVKAFKNTNAAWYWSSTTHEHYKHKAWNVYFKDGDIQDKNKGYYNFTKCVRGGK